MEKLEFSKMAIKKVQKDNIQIEINCIYSLEAPVEKNKIIGNVKVGLEGENIEILNILVKENVEKKEIKDYLLDFLSLVP